jgi:hypothetical protein
MSNLIAVVQVVRLRIIEVDGALDETQTQDTGVKVDIALRVAANCRDVVDAGGRRGRRDHRAACFAGALALSLIPKAH